MTKSAKKAGKKLTSRAKSLGSLAKRNWLKILFVVIVIVGFVWVGIQYKETRDQLTQLKNPNTAGQTEIEIVTNQVKNSIELPANETPTLATVSDSSKLKSQLFFKNAENGDKVLIYTKSGKALLYRPAWKKVIEYSNVTLTNSAQPQTGQQ